LSLFRKAQDEAVRMKACFYGKPGVGKSWTALHFPKPVVIDLEKGTALYGADFDFGVLRTQDVKVIEDAVDELMVDPQDYRTLIIDPMSVYCDLVQEDFLKQKRIDTGDPNAALKGTDYGPIKARIRRFINKLLSLDLNIVVTAREKPEFQEGAFMKQVGVLPDIHKEVPHMFDTIIWIYIDDEGNRRGIAHPDVAPGVVAKDRSKLPKEKFIFNYENLEKSWGLEGLSRKAESVTKQAATIEVKREVDIVLDSGSGIKTAGITAEQLKKLEDKIGKDKKRQSEFATFLQSNYGVGTAVDLREDEAELVISSLN